MLIRVLFAIILTCGPMGCSSIHTGAHTHVTPTPVSVPPDRIDLLEAARRMHFTGKHAGRYPILRQAVATSDGGYEIRFGKTGGFGLKGVSYYFDPKGHFTHSMIWLCDGY